MTLGAGGSGGIEGPSIPVGQYVGTGVAKILEVRDIMWLRVLEMCGISAAITTLLHAPLTGAVFARSLCLDVSLSIGAHLLVYFFVNCFCTIQSFVRCGVFIYHQPACDSLHAV